LNRLNVKNGLLDLETGELQPHTPEHRSSIQLPVEYDAEADCPTWHKFVEEVF
jgi:putative DNA primase/helicase